MTVNLVVAMFLLSYTLTSVLYQAVTARTMGMLALVITAVCGLTGTLLLWRTAEEQVPSE